MPLPGASRHCLREEAKEGQADTRPQAREQRKCVAIIRRGRAVNVGQAPHASLADSVDFDGSEAETKDR